MGSDPGTFARGAGYGEGDGDGDGAGDTGGEGAGLGTAGVSETSGVNGSRAAWVGLGLGLGPCCPPVPPSLVPVAGLGWDCGAVVPPVAVGGDAVFEPPLCRTNTNSNTATTATPSRTSWFERILPRGSTTRPDTRMVLIAVAFKSP